MPSNQTSISTGDTATCRLICLTGFMGCGKTTIGRQLARQLGWHFLDLDTSIEQDAGLTISEIFARHGEPEFRELEHTTLQRALGENLSRSRAAVIALGGGTFAMPRNVELLREAGAFVIWIDCEIELLLSRCSTKSNRPLFQDEKSFRELFERRRPCYEQADARVAGEADSRRVVEQILSLKVLEKVGA